MIQKNTLQKQTYLEAKELRSNLKKTAVDLKMKEEQCSSDIRSLNTSVHMWQKKTRELQVWTEVSLLKGLTHSNCGCCKKRENRYVQKVCTLPLIGWVSWFTTMPVSVFHPVIWVSLHNFDTLDRWQFTGVGTSGTLWVQGAESNTQRCCWRSDDGLPRFQR